MPARQGGRGALDLTRPLRKALGMLQAERDRIDQQITGIQRALAVLSGGPQVEKGRAALRRAPQRRAMSEKARKALSRRMKAYWAKRRGATAKKKVKGQA